MKKAKVTFEFRICSFICTINSKNFAPSARYFGNTENILSLILVVNNNIMDIGNTLVST